MVSFTSVQEALSYEIANEAALRRLQREAEAVPGVEYSEVWLNGNCPSFVAGYDNQDEVIVCFKV